MTPSAKAHWQIHLCVLLWGFTAILGKVITLQALPLVWWRMLLVAATLLLVPRVWRGLRAMPRRLLLSYAGIGVLVALHWLTFYGAIKLSNASVAATCMAFATVFVAMIEPKLAHRKFSRAELALGVAVLPGVALVVGGIPDDMRIGVLVGAVSALFVALFGSLNKRLVDHADPLTVTAVELGAGTIALTVLAPLMPLVFPALAGPLFVLPGAHDAGYLLLLAFACTLFPFALSLVALRHMSAFSAQLAVNLEPIYAIMLAIVLLSEQQELSTRFYVGVAIILAAVLVHPLIARPRRIRHAETLATGEARDVTE
ncbi:DMT family transporter [Luteimonas sp. MC1572]|uniref:DMT family transporter n=1 Tax=Luteimonas sp. MC1572 TaxID=2799325 RepID=UPI0018F0933A|nr:DMT family transporter [Luteimonas sp. MC1572]MBJ6982687.1 DMT family transporter [Luteimonas sp. MC1572]QQO03929.1 DMT family transporter [Luteimonas sp. MC1572]